MAQSKDQLERELADFKMANNDCMTVEWKTATVTGFNTRLASLTGNNCVEFIMWFGYFLVILFRRRATIYFVLLSEFFQRHSRIE